MAKIGKSTSEEVHGSNGISEHTGHRQRVKTRFLNYGMESFDQHQVLETVLFYVIPRKDTNLLAHRLLNRFGSLDKVFDASADELMSVNGIGPNASAYLKMFPAVFRHYELSRDNRNECFDTLEKLGAYATKLFIGATVEQAYLMMFNNRLQMIDTCRLSEGAVNSTLILPRLVVEHSLVARASSVVIAHNHPYGNTIATREDIDVTHIVESACNLVGIQLLDHLVVAGTEYSSILRSQRGLYRNSPLTGKPDPSFFRNFYAND